MNVTIHKFIGFDIESGEHVYSGETNVFFENEIINSFDYLKDYIEMYGAEDSCVSIKEPCENAHEAVLELISIARIRSQYPSSVAFDSHPLVDEWKSKNSNPLIYRIYKIGEFLRVNASIGYDIADTFYRMIVGHSLNPDIENNLYETFGINEISNARRHEIYNSEPFSFQEVIDMESGLEFL